MKKTFPKTEEELADRFDAGEDLESLGFDVEKAQVEQPRLKRVNVDFPEHMLAKLLSEKEKTCTLKLPVFQIGLFRRSSFENRFSYQVLRIHYVFDFADDFFRSFLGNNDNPVDIGQNKIACPDRDAFDLNRFFKGLTRPGAGDVARRLKTGKNWKI